ncbi:type VI secretion system Vgr family protein [Pseudomonas sp. PD9R]|uniref:type VI secretion system Vgr family protein n=1 Tax=Pseudomonas sp. PD9R TaxID=2853534 RepID=UPI001C476549|nr:type VI secretion system tip protein TssI/VgrG [Pseudomonas sp. PD9R]MBV6824801.1 type VI secretion system tip protein VgrG [Pseudomonas sp. PD9R]
MHNDKESPFTLTLLDDDLSLHVVQFSGLEALNQPYRFDIEVIGLAPAIHPDRLLQQSAFLSLGQGLGIHGVLHSASREHCGAHRVGYKVVLVPALQALDRYRCRRIFVHLSVPMILRQLLEEHELPDDSYRFELTLEHYPLRPFCIQYDETDLALLQRLCEEEGIHYHFEHQRNAHVLVVADDSLSFPQAPLLMPFHSDASDDESQPLISELFQRHDSPPSPSGRNARNRGAPDADDGAANHPITRPPPMSRPAPEQHHGDQLARRHLERLRCLQLQIHGQSNNGELSSGRIVQVADHPLPGFNDQWLVTQARHQGHQRSILAQDTPDRLPHYHNQFSAIPWSTAFRPPLKQTKPSVPGYQPAHVCGPAGQPAALDDQGRIQVRLWPAQPAVAQASNSLWLPIALTTVHGRIDPACLPLAGSDGWVSFLDSDPDRPVFCASTGHRDTPPPARDHQPRSDSRLLLDWLINPTQPKP